MDSHHVDDDRALHCDLATESRQEGHGDECLPDLRDPALCLDGEDYGWFHWQSSSGQWGDGLDNGINGAGWAGIIEIVVEKLVDHVRPVRPSP